MTLLHLLLFAFVVAGSTVAGSLGHEHFGLWGLVLGILVGGGIGLLAGIACSLLMAAVFHRRSGNAAQPAHKLHPSPADDDTDSV
jgi:hypothetical protein